LKELDPVFCEDLLKEIDDKLFDIMKNIPLDDWNTTTLYPDWKVKDIFSHILDTSIRRLSDQRDMYHDTNKVVQITSYQDLVEFIEKLADEWAAITRRISPQVLLSLFSLIKNELYVFMKNMKPFDDAAISVAWAGEKKSKIWFDNAREYSEHWIHQEQIRDALNIEPLDNSRYLMPVLETLIRCLPVAYSNIHKDNGTTVQIKTTGSVISEYYLEKNEEKWELYIGSCINPNSFIIVDSFQFCKMLSRIIEPNTLKYEIFGDKELGRNIEKAIALMA
jgi:hypothetical protein